MRSSSSPRAVSMIRGTLRSAPNPRHTSSPLILGSIRSSTTRSGLVRRYSSSASPSAASTTAWPSRLRYRPTTYRMFSSSSTTRILAVLVSAFRTQQTMLFEGGAGRRKVGAARHKPSQVVQVFHLVHVEGGLDPPDGEAGGAGAGGDVVEDGVRAHGYIVQDVVPTAHPDQVIPPVVGRPEDELVLFERTKRLFHDPDVELGRVGCDEYGSLLPAPRRPAKQVPLALRPVPVSLKEDARLAVPIH